MKTITIAGNIGKDAVTRQAGSDNVTSFSVAVEERGKDGKRTLWFDCSIWGKRGDTLAQYLTKGSKVAVSGELSTREHEGKTYLSVRVAEITLQGGREAAPAASGAGSSFDDDMPDDDVPFISARGVF